MHVQEIDTEYWQRITTDKKVAREVLMNLVTPQGRVTFMTLDNGAQLPINQVTEEQAIEFMRSICPSWAKQ